MLLEYTNRRNEKHYLRAATTAKGKTRYYIIKNLAKFAQSELLSTMPDDYEFYEFPDNAQVAIRKKIHPIFSLQEKEVVSNVMKKHDAINDFIIDLTEHALVIHTADMIREHFPDTSEDFFIQCQSYPAQMLFTKKENQYTVHRFCHLSRHYGWIPLETSADLYALASKFTYHIGRESLLQFWVEGEEDY